MTRNKVIVTDASLRTALCVIRSLGRRGLDVTAAESATNPLLNLGFASRWARRCVTVPNPIYEEEAYVEALLKLCAGSDVLLPISMYSLKIVAKHASRFREVIRVPVTDHDTLIRANSTDSAIKAALSCGVPVPRTWFITDIGQIDSLSRELEFPVFIKVKDELELSPAQRHSAAYSREDFIHKYLTLHSLQPFPIIQEFVKGDGVGFFALFDSGTRPRAVFGHRRVREYPLDGGPSTRCDSYYDERMFDYGLKLLKSLDWYGLAMVEFKLDERDSTPKFMEINPRVWGSMPLAVNSGVDFPFLWYKMAMGEDFTDVTEFKRGEKLRFFLSDLRGAAASLNKLKKVRRNFLGFARDLFDPDIKDGIFDLGDVKPWLVNATKAFSLLLPKDAPRPGHKKFDLHVHSKYSYDSLSSPADIVRTARARGLDGIAVTDHDTIRGAVEAKKYETADFHVILGEEISTDRGDILGLFIKEEIREKDFEKAVAEIHRQGGIAVLAHPYKRAGALPDETACGVDAIEAFNSRAEIRRGSVNNARASELAFKTGMPVLGGSDAHFLFEIGRGRTVVKAPDTSGLKDAILSRRTTSEGRISSAGLDFLSQFVKMVKLRRPGMLLKAPARICRYFAGRNAAGEYGKILLLMVAGIGDFFESIPALKSIRDSCPGARISLLVSSKVYDYAKDCPYVDEVGSLPVARGRGFSLAGAGALKRYLSLVLQLRKKSFDVALNFYAVSSWAGAARMALLLTAAGIKTTFGRNTHGRGFFFSRNVEEKEEDRLSQADYFNALAGLLTRGKSVTKVMPWITDADERSTAELISSLGLEPPARIMLVNPGSDRPSRRWFPGDFAKVIDHFSAAYSLNTVFTGSASEKGIIDEIAALTKARTFCAAGRLSIGGTAALVRRAEILFTTNSAAMHIAGAFGIPFAAAAGSGNPFKDRPDGQAGMMSLLWEKTACNPCDFYQCPRKDHMACMKLHTAEEMIAEGERLLKIKGRIP